MTKKDYSDENQTSQLLVTSTVLGSLFRDRWDLMRSYSLIHNTTFNNCGKHANFEDTGVSCNGEGSAFVNEAVWTHLERRIVLLQLVVQDESINLFEYQILF
jgi:hypothetical protein